MRCNGHRIATDLNLHQPSSTKITSEKHEREILNRTRTWMICFNLDRSTSTQLGKPSTIKEDFIIRNSTDWYKRSAYNLPYDVHLCAYTELLRLVTRFHEEVYSDQSVSNGLNKVHLGVRWTLDALLTGLPRGVVAGRLSHDHDAL